MFQCQLCQGVVPPGTPSQRLVIEKRKKQYPFRSKANVVVFVAKDGKHKKEYRDDPGGEGQEIVKELVVCPECATRNGRK